MSGKQRKLKKVLSFLLCFCFMVVGVKMPAFAAQSDAQTAEETKTESTDKSTDIPEKSTDTSEPEVVRVGWYEDAYHITAEDGQRSGYGYEYEQAVAAYTGWKYEYVEGGWNELLEMLKNGEIDMMGALSYTDERAENMLFSDLPMGEEKYYLYADLVHTDISASDLSTLNGKRIDMIKGGVQEIQYTEWEEKTILPPSMYIQKPLKKV